MAFTQFLKRFPLNLRPMFFIKKDYNPKGLGLFLYGYVKLYCITQEKCYLEKIDWITSLLVNLRCSAYEHFSWGYNFDWQNYRYLFPKETPTTVNTSFIADAFIDAYEALNNSRFLDIARSACDFLLKDQYLTKTNDSICFSYTPMDQSKVHNANMLAARLLARVFSITQEEELWEHARKAVNYTMSAQRQDGAWYYGERHVQKYIDNFHTGFVLESLNDYISYTNDMSHSDNLRRGLKFYSNHLFLPNGTPKYFHDRVYPIDTHNIQALITFVKLQNVMDNTHLLQRISSWIIDHMQDKSGYFYYRRGKYLTNKIPYIRWGQAWAFHALTTYYQYLVQNGSVNNAD